MKNNFRGEKISEGNWGKDVKWEFYLSDKLSDIKLVAAVFGIPLYNNKIALTKSYRGWELPGGHLDEDETIEEALVREIKEEIGVEISDYKIIGFRKVICLKNPIKTKMEDFILTR